MDQNVDIKTAAQHKKAKKRLLIVVCSLVGVLALLIAASFIIDMIEAKKEQGSGEISFKFHEADYDEYIFDDERYMDKIAGGFINYYKNNVSVGITRENAKDQSPEVEFIVETLYDVIYGEHDEYNSRFSSEYYATNARKERFTMQKLYDVTISFEASEEIVNAETGANYTKSIYGVKYKIFENNGTFRRDIGEGSRIQYITITNKSGEWLIDSVITPSYN